MTTARQHPGVWSRGHKRPGRTPEIQGQRAPEARTQKRKTRRSVVGMEQQRKVGGSSRKSEPTEPTEPTSAAGQGRFMSAAHSPNQSTHCACPAGWQEPRARTCPWSALAAGLLGCWAAGSRLGVLPQLQSLQKCGTIENRAAGYVPASLYCVQDAMPCAVDTPDVNGARHTVYCTLPFDAGQRWASLRIPSFPHGHPMM